MYSKSRVVKPPKIAAFKHPKMKPVIQGVQTMIWILEQIQTTENCVSLNSHIFTERIEKMHSIFLDIIKGKLSEELTDRLLNAFVERDGAGALARFCWLRRWSKIDLDGEQIAFRDG